jgi:hypothetical protein
MLALLDDVLEGLGACFLLAVGALTALLSPVMPARNTVVVRHPRCFDMPAPKRRRRCSPPQLLSLIAGALAPAHHDPAALARLLPPVALEVVAGPGRALGPAGGRRKTLVLDLDETLLHSMHSRPVAPVDMSLMVPSPSLLRLRFRLLTRRSPSRPRRSGTSCATARTCACSSTR